MMLVQGPVLLPQMHSITASVPCVSLQGVPNLAASGPVSVMLPGQGYMPQGIVDLAVHDT